MTTVHLVNPFKNACGGSEQRTVHLFGALAEFGPVELWSDGPPDARLLGRYPFKVIDASRGFFPRQGTLVLVGVYFGIPQWIRNSQFERIVLVHNISLRDEVRFAITVIRKVTDCPIEVVCAGKELVSQLDGMPVSKVDIENSWIDIERFRPMEKRVDRPFTIGRMSRDVPDKFHQPDVDLFTNLANDGFEVRIMGGKSLFEDLSRHPSIELLEEGSIDAVEFLQSLDVLLYRTADKWFEAFGRVVIESMACGVVPVAHVRGGYAVAIEHGLSGVLYTHDDEAIDWLAKLRSEPAMLESMALAARNQAESMYGHEAKKLLAQRYFGDFD